MPPVERDAQYQRAVLWAANGTITRYGEKEVSAAVEIPARWEEGILRTVNEDGTPSASSGTIHLDQAVAAGSIMWLGKLVDLPSPISESTGLMEVVGVNEMTDISGRDIKHDVTVQKFRGALPTVS